MKKIIIFFFVLSTFFANAQNRIISPNRENGKYGAREYESNKVIIPFVYSSFNECDIECAKYNLNKTWKTINTNGKGQLAENFRTDSIYVSSENGDIVAKVKKQLIYKTGFISKNGQEIIPYKLSETEIIIGFPQYIKLNSDWGFFCIGPDVYDDKGNLKGVIGGGFLDGLGKEKIPLTNLLNYDYVRSGIVKQNNKWGKVDFFTGKEIIPIKYDGIEYEAYYDSLDRPLHKVKLNNKWGIIDNEGKEYFQIKYDSIGGDYINTTFINMKLKNKWGLVNLKGEEIIPFEYDDILVLIDNKVLVKKNNKWAIIDLNKKIYIDFQYDDVIPENLAEMGNGYIIGTAGYNFLKVKQNNKWGALFLQDTLFVQNFAFYDNFGGNEFDTLVAKQQVFDIKYDEINFYDKYYYTTFKDDIKVKAKAKLNGKIGFIDNKGKENFYNEIGEFFLTTDQRLLAAVKLNDKFGFIDEEGNQVVPCKYDTKYEQIYYDTYSRYHMAKLNGKYGVVDTTGKEIISCKYDKVNYYNNKILAIKLNSKWGVIDITGKETITCKYDAVKVYSDSAVMVQSNNKWGVIDVDGREIIPCIHDSLIDTPNGYQILVDNKWGVINKKNEEIIQPQYDFISEFSWTDSVATVRKNGKWGFVDVNWKEIITCKYDSVGYGYGFFTHGLIAVKLKNKWGIIDTKEKEVVRINYDYIDGIDYDGDILYIVRVMRNKKWGFINPKTGVEMIPCKYDEAGSFDIVYDSAFNGMKLVKETKVKLNNREFYIDINGNEIKK
ncbi:MAG: WG repeat-containing protein [Bacteroidota bacterium]